MEDRIGPDMCVACGDGLLNIRVGAIIVRDGRVLTVRSKNGYCYSVGGRIKFGETAEQAIVREVEEETGRRLSIDRLGFVNEVYFINDSPQMYGKPVYELAFYFYMNAPEDFEPKTDHIGDGEERVVWIAPDSPETVYPDFLRTAITDPQAGVIHIVRDDR